MPANPKPPKPIRDAAYKRSAKDRKCDVRECEWTFGDTTSTVLAHIRIAGNCGIGLKPSDDESLFLCFMHHKEFDESPDRNDWLVRNILIPQRKAAYRAEVARRAGR